MEQNTHIYYYKEEQDDSEKMPEKLYRSPNEAEETPFEKWWTDTAQEYARQAAALKQRIANGDMIDIILTCRDGKYSMWCADYPLIWAYKPQDERFQLPKEGEELRIEVSPVTFRPLKRSVEVSRRKTQENAFEKIKEKYKVGDAIEGKIKTFNPKLNMLFVDFGDIDGVLFPDFLIRPITSYSEGDKIKAYVTGIDDKNCRLTFSQTFNQNNPPLQEADEKVDMTIGEEHQVVPITFNITNREKGDGWVKLQYGDYFSSMSTCDEYDIDALSQILTLGQPVTCIYCGTKIIGKKSQLRWCLPTAANKERIQSLLPFINHLKTKSGDGTVDLSTMAPITANFPLDMPEFIKKHGYTFDAKITAVKLMSVEVKHDREPSFVSTLLKADLLRHPIEYKEGETIRIYLNAINPASPRPLCFKEGNVCKSVQKAALAPAPEEKNIWRFTLERLLQEGDTLQAIPYKAENGILALGYCGYVGIIRFGDTKKPAMLMRHITLGQPMDVLYKDITTLNGQERLEFTLTQAIQEQLDNDINAHGKDTASIPDFIPPGKGTMASGTILSIDEGAGLIKMEVDLSGTLVDGVLPINEAFLEPRLLEAGDRMPVYIASVNPDSSLKLSQTSTKLKIKGTDLSEEAAQSEAIPDIGKVCEVTVRSVVKNGYLNVMFNNKTGQLRKDSLGAAWDVVFMHLPIGTTFKAVYAGSIDNGTLLFTLPPSTLDAILADPFLKTITARKSKHAGPEIGTREEMTVDSVTDDAISGHAGAYPIRVMIDESFTLKSHCEELFGDLKDIITPGTRLNVEVTGQSASKKTFNAVLASAYSKDEGTEPGEKEATIVAMLDYAALIDIEGLGLCMAAADALADTVEQLRQLTSGSKVRVNVQLFENTITGVSNINQKTYPFAPEADQTEIEVEILNNFAKFSLCKDSEGRIIRLSLSKLGGKFSSESYKQYRPFMIRPQAGTKLKCCISRIDGNKYSKYLASIICPEPEFEDRLYRQTVKGRVICQTMVNDMPTYIVDIGTRLGLVTQDKYSWKNKPEAMNAGKEELEFVSLGYMGGTLKNILNLSRLSFDTVNLSPGKSYKGKTTVALRSENITGVELRNGYTVYVPTQELHGVPGATSPIGDGAIMPDCPVTVKFVRPDLRLAKLIGTVDKS